MTDKEKWQRRYQSGYTYRGRTPGTGIGTASTGLASTGTQGMSAKTSTPTNKYQSQYEAAYNALANRDKFRYSQKDDPLYQQYADMYTKQARLAMQDTVGQVSALTGGYGNSYAETAGQAMYMQSMDKLNERALDLYNAALNAYNAEGDRLAQNFNAASSMYGTEQDNNRWATELAYQQNRDAVADSRYAQEWAHQLEREGVEDARYKESQDYAKTRDSAEDRYRWAAAGLDPTTGGRTSQSQLEWLAQNGNDEGVKAYVNNMKGVSQADKDALISQYSSHEYDNPYQGDVEMAAKTYITSEILPAEDYRRMAKDGDYKYNDKTYEKYVEDALDKDVKSGKISPYVAAQVLLDLHIE